MENKDICFITSFNNKLLNKYAKFFLKSYTIPFDLHIFSEEKMDVSKYTKHIMKYTCNYIFDNDEEYKEFINSNGPSDLDLKKNFSKCIKKSCYKYCCEHYGHGPKCEKHMYCKTPKCGMFRNTHGGRCINCVGIPDMIKITKIFSYKVFSIMNCMLKYPDYKYYIWIDADMKIIKQFDVSLIQKILQGNNDFIFAFLERYCTFLEAGFMIFNTSYAPTKDYFASMRELYLSNDIYYLHQTHDAFVWHLMKDRYLKMGFKCFSLTKEIIQKSDIGKNINVLEKHPLLSKHIFHFKGKLKENMKK